jgi:hypothetical protein
MALGLEAKEDPLPEACVASDIQNRIRPGDSARRRGHPRKTNYQYGKHTWLELVVKLLAMWVVMWLHLIFWLIGKSTQNQNHLDIQVLKVHELYHHHASL